MQFASPIPLWAAVIVAAAGVGVAYLAYRRPRVPLTPQQRGVLTALRACTLLAIVVVLCRPVALVPPADAGRPVVPVLIDVSRSMRIADGRDSRTRLADAVALVDGDIRPSLDRAYAAELYTFGSELAPLAAENLSKLSADARGTDLEGALARLRDRLRGRPVAGVVVVSDGADTTPTASESSGDTATTVQSGDRAWPIVAVGVGATEHPRDREVTGLAAGEPRIDASTIDLRVALTSHGLGREPFEVRVLANGRVVDARTVTPRGDGAPFDELFTVTPDGTTPTVFTAEIAAADTIDENNARSVVVGPSGRRRRVLMIAGAPGYDHSFAMRALAADPGLEVDAIVRKGKNDAGQDTFLVQAASSRAASLMNGFPATREALFVYDAVVIANMESDAFTRAQLELAAAFVAERGGGLLLFGGQSFAQGGFANTALADALAVELGDRRGAPVRLAGSDRAGGPHTVVLTPAGEDHPVMRIGEGTTGVGRVWAELPPLAASAPLGGPRPGGTVLAVTRLPGGAVHPLVAVQRYGRGRSLVFGGEAAWRWRMLRPAEDRSFEYFWRQSLRWLSGSAPEPVSLTLPDTAEPGSAVNLELDVRDRAYNPVPDATIDATLTDASGNDHRLLMQSAADPGRFVAAATVSGPGLHRVRASATRSGSPLGEADGWFYVGGLDREFADPRLDEGTLRRLAHASGGQFFRPDDAGDVASILSATSAGDLAFERRELWQRPSTFLLIVALLAAEWILRRRWGLR